MLQMSRRELDSLARDLVVGRRGGVGINIAPYRVGGVQIRPRMVGAPVAMMQVSEQPPIQVSPDQYLGGENTYMGLGRTIIPAGSLGTTVPVSIKRSITPQRILCPSNVQNLLIIAINIENTGIFANALGVPIELFSEVATNPQIDWPTLDPATGVEFIVANPTLGDLVFSGALYGPQVRK